MRWHKISGSVANHRKQVSLSRLNHWLPRGQAHPEVVQGTAEFHHQITDTLLPQANPVFHDATALDTAVDMFNPQPTLVQRLVGPLLLQSELLAREFLRWHQDLVWSKNSCSFARVVFQEPSEPFTTLHRALALCIVVDRWKE